MIRSIRYITLLTLLQFVTGTPVLYARSIISAFGIMRDSVSREPLSYVSVMLENSTIRAMTDDDGALNLQSDKRLTRLVVSSPRYDNRVINLKARQKSDNLDVLSSPTSFRITEVEVRPTRRRYPRKGNPTAELTKKVIECKNSNRIEMKGEYQSKAYEKLSMSPGDFNPNLEGGRFLRKFEFIEDYLDASEFNGKPILTISIRETVSDQYCHKHPKTEKTATRTKRQQGVNKTLDDGDTITANPEGIFKGVNIFDNDISILLSRFVNPLSSMLAVPYYKYYIMDTVDIVGDKCTDLTSVSVGNQGYGFTGRLYATLDGNYAIEKFLLNTPANINLSWVDRLQIEQESKQISDSIRMLANENIYVNFHIIKGAQQPYAHQLGNFGKYQFDMQNADSTFDLLGPIHELPEVIAQTDTLWIHNHHVPSKEKRSALDDLLTQLRKIPAFNTIIRIAEILITGYIPTTADKDKSKFDPEPMSTTLNANHLEGFRMRMRGVATTNPNPHWFGSGYLAYDVSDRKLKCNAKLTYSASKKKYHEEEGPVNNISAIQKYSVYMSGQDFLFTSKDSMLVTWEVGEPVIVMQYTRETILRHQEGWLSSLAPITWTRDKNNEAARTPRYDRYNADEISVNLKSFTDTELGAQLRFAPGGRAYNGREGRNSLFNLSKDAPVFKLSHQIGLENVLGNGFNYSHTEISVKKRIQLSSFGRIGALATANKVWDRAPLPLLIMLNTNQSIAIQPQILNVIRALEFVSGQYASFCFTYYMKGWILNRIPSVKQLRLCKIVSFNGFYGELTDKSNPTLDPTGLYRFPEGVSPMSHASCLETNVDLENIFKILWTDYYRRLTYLDRPNIKKGGARTVPRLSF